MGLCKDWGESKRNRGCYKTLKEIRTLLQSRQPEKAKITRGEIGKHFLDMRDVGFLSLQEVKKLQDKTFDWLRSKGFEVTDVSRPTSDKDYVRENNARYDKLDKIQPITEDVLDDMYGKFEAVKKQKEVLKKEWGL